jgi:cytochrome c oxidase subunit 1
VTRENHFQEQLAMKFLRIGLVRGLLAGLLAAGLGMGLAVGIRVLLGWPAWVAAPVTAVGALFAVVGFLIGVGVFADWWKLALGQKVADHHEPPAGMPRWTRYLSWDPSHKVIGIQYAVTAVLLMLFAGVLALLVRLELAQPGMQFLNPDQYNQVMGVHGIVMIGTILIGIAGLANYLVPLLIGANDMAFPRLNAFSYWLIPPAAGLIVTTLFTGGFDTGWTGYPPLGVRDPLGAQFFYLGVFVLGLSSILGSINLITTIMKMRAPGMKLFRMPIFVWGILATSLIQLVATQFIAMAFLLVLAERLFHMGFFDPIAGGSALLYQNIFWFYSHPVVYVFVLPGFGLISEILPVFARKPLFGYRAVAISSMAIAFVGFLVWAHHMFATGMSAAAQIYFMFATLLVAVPTGVKIFSWLGTLWGGKMTFPAPALFVLGGLGLFLVGGLTGPFLAIAPVDLYLSKTYWVVSHFHQIMFGGYVSTLMAAIFFWFPKVTGLMYKEKLGKLQFWMMLVGLTIMNVAMYRLGLAGMLRRVADYDPQPGFAAWNTVATVGGFIIGLSFLVFVINMVVSLAARQPAPANPWRSRSPEWQIPSPPPEESYPTPPVVVGEPYDYGVPGSEYVRFGAGAETTEAGGEQ